jgi:uncharacterized protein YndB with AHSA1/START domain
MTERTITHSTFTIERVFSYVTHFGGNKLSASLQSMELQPIASGTLLVLTEHGAYLDGHDIPTGREEGTRGLLDQLAAVLEA